MSTPRRGGGRPGSGRSGAPNDAGRRRSSANPDRRAASARGGVAGGRRADGPPRSRGDHDERPRREPSGRERVPNPALPPVPEDADPSLLDRGVRAELRSLSKPNAEAVAKYLVAAGEAVDTDPVRALAFARAARARAARVAAVREAVGIAAYHASEWAEALTELRTARRISGDPRNLPVIADCERALGKPEQAAKVLGDPDVRRLDAETRTELLIVVAGARRDLGQLDAALSVLARGGLDREHPRAGAARLWYAYADILAAAGRTEEAASWFAASAALDPDGELDAAERAAALL
jgi:tetratricopeptide (TPR) repeat protein